MLKPLKSTKTATTKKVLKPLKNAKTAKMFYIIRQKMKHILALFSMFGYVYPTRNAACCTKTHKHKLTDIATNRLKTQDARLKN